MITPYIKSIGYYVPEKTVSNDDLAKVMDTSDEWIFSHTGIKNRHFAGENENNSDLATKAAETAMKKAGITADDVDMIFACTTTPDYLSFPATACIVQENIGAKNAGAFDLSAACSGFIYGIETASTYIKSGAYKNIIVIGCEILSRIIDMSDRNTAVLFGDGAGAVVISPRDDNNSGSAIISSHLRSEGSGAEFLKRHAGGTKNPFIPGKSDPQELFLFMNGRQVYNFAIRAVTDTVLSLMESNNLKIDDIKYIFPHQANIRIIEGVAKRSSIPIEKFYLNIERFANTSAASIPIAIGEADEKNLLQRGDKIITVGFGGGLTYGGNYIRW